MWRWLSAIDVATDVYDVDWESEQPPRMAIGDVELREELAVAIEGLAKLGLATP